MQKISPHNLPPDFQLKKTLETEIGMIYFYDNIVIVEANEGIVFSYKNGFSVLLKTLNILGTKPWVYISNRVQSYSVKPIDYKYLNKVPSLKAMAIVVYSDIAQNNTALESKFCKKPFGVFQNVSDAVIWGKGFL
ncbi:MAG: hypothetical protein Q8O62_04165 [Aequorivita sp.]|nr:hypothetical protein [Aequorivita sp.]